MNTNHVGSSTLLRRSAAYYLAEGPVAFAARLFAPWTWLPNLFRKTEIPIPVDSFDGVFAAPPEVVGLTDCVFYHTTDLPGGETVEGLWDLRSHEAEYLGEVEFEGKRVLDVGTASGFLAFFMESRGASVTGYDLSEDFSWDIVPFAEENNDLIDRERRATIRKLNNSFWFCHSAFQSEAKLAYGSVYAIPAELGPVDISVFGCILLHLRDPLLALQSAAALTRDCIVVTDLLWAGASSGPTLTFAPDAAEESSWDTWWALSPLVVERFLGVLGFTETTTSFHSQMGLGELRALFTVVGRRPSASPHCEPPSATLDF